MFCPNCGKQLPDGSRFCGFCGKSVNAAAQPDPSGAKVNTERQAPPGAAPGKAAEKKKFPLKIVIIAAAAVVVIVIAAVILIPLLLGKSKSADNAYVYLSDGSYELVTNLKKGTSVEISSSKFSDISSNLVKFSSDGTYVYYYTKYDYDTYTGTLCRAQYSKLKENSSKNDKYIETIASNAGLGFSMLSDDSIVYRTSDDALYYYSGEGTVCIAKEISGYSVSDDIIIYYVCDDSDYTYDIYGVDTDDIDNVIELAGSVDGYYDITDPDNILYYVYEDYDEGTKTLYSVGMDGDAATLAEGVYTVLQYDDDVYYLAENGQTVSLYDYVIDDYAQSDSSITEPDIEDYVITAYDFDRLYYDDDNSEVTEYYTSCTNSITFYSSGWFYRSMEYAAEYDDELGEYFQTFVDKYLEQEDVYGYILVTDEVKEDLITLVTACGYESDYWIECCFSREEDGTTYDYDTYYDDLDIWYSAADRIELRAELQDTENDIAVRTLYQYSDGESTPLAENILYLENDSGMLICSTTGSVSAQVNIEEISSIYDVSLTLYPEVNADAYALLFSTGESITISEEFVDIYTSLGGEDYVYFDAEGDFIFLVGEDDSLYSATIKDNVLTGAELLSDCAEIISADEDVVYYFADTYTDDMYYTYGDLYCYDGEESTCLARDIITYYATIYSDDVVLAYTYVDYIWDDYEWDEIEVYELAMINAKGEETIIAYDVSYYVRVDSDTLLYISDDDLYYYDGDESVLVAYDVDYFWSLNSLDYIRSY